MTKAYILRKFWDSEHHGTKTGFAFLSLAVV